LHTKFEDDLIQQPLTTYLSSLATFTNDQVVISEDSSTSWKVDDTVTRGFPHKSNWSEFAPTLQLIAQTNERVNGLEQTDE